jgi:OTT_1508-like deaminase
MGTGIEEYFCDLARDINFLGRLVAAWETFRDYAARHSNYEFIFHPIEPPKINPPNAETLFGKINSYRENMPGKRGTLKRLSKGGPLDFAVHCEMQLLLYFDASSQSKASFPYFGCSKYSCWMCNEILVSHSKYRTKGTHGRRVGLWAFDSEKHSPETISALESLQNKIMNSWQEEKLRADISDKVESLKKG